MNETITLGGQTWTHDDFIKWYADAYGVPTWEAEIAWTRELNRNKGKKISAEDAFEHVRNAYLY